MNELGWRSLSSGDKVEGEGVTQNGLERIGREIALTIRHNKIK